MFFLNSLTARGAGASITWGYHTAARLVRWRVVKSKENVWTLSADVDRADRWQLAQRPLYFSVPRRGGFYTWPIVSIALGAETLTAKLGPPEA